MRIYKKQNLFLSKSLKKWNGFKNFPIKIEIRKNWRIYHSSHDKLREMDGSSFAKNKYILKKAMFDSTINQLPKVENIQSAIYEKDLETVIHYYKKMIEKNEEISEELYNEIIRLSANKKKLSLSTELMFEMMDNNFIPNHVTLLVVAKMHWLNLSLNVTLSFLQFFEECKNRIPKESPFPLPVYSSMIGLYIKMDMREKAELLMKEVEELGFLYFF